MEDDGVCNPGSANYDHNEGNCTVDQKDNPAQYNIQSVLHFIQSEWTRLELQRSQWEMERAELQARIAFLQGERRGQENIKQDLVRRIKMLEHALKQERVRYHQLRSSGTSNIEQNTDLVVKTDNTDGLGEYKNIMDPGQLLARATEQALHSNAKWRESRLKLKHFLHEVGYTDTVLAARQSRVRQLLCATRGDFSDGEVINNLKRSPLDRNSNRLREAEEAVIHTFDFLETVPNAEDKPINADTSAPWSQDKDGPTSMGSLMSSFDSRTGQPKRFGRKGGLDSGLVEFLNTLSEDVPEMEGSTHKSNGNSIWPMGALLPGHAVDGELAGASFNAISGSAAVSGGESSEAAAGLGDLASLTVANESDMNGGDADQAEGPCYALRDETQKSSAASSNVTTTGGRRPWVHKFLLRGHFDAVRSAVFHPSEPYLFTAGEDGLVMLWTLHRPGSPKPSAMNSKPAVHVGGAELEPVHVYRGHQGPVLCVAAPAMGQCASSVYSAGLDGIVRGWRLPDADTYSGLFDLYSLSQDVNECGLILKRPNSVGDAVWSIAVHPSQPILASVDTASALTFWPLQSDILVNTPDQTIAPSRTVFLNDLLTSSLGQAAVGRPTSVTYFSNRPDPSNPTQCLVGTTTGWLALVDVETGTLVNKVAPPTSHASVKVADSAGGTSNGAEESDSSNNDFCRTTFPVADWGELGIHGITVHQTFSLAITGHEDRCIRFYDIGRQQGNSGCVSTTVTHLDAVTCLTVDPHDLYVLTGSHDSSIRLWDLETRTCIQEITCHRVKNNESVHSVAMHPTLPFSASAGADGVCKVYTSQ